MIQLLGYRPDDDIAIEYTGIRPGEKLHEAMFAPDEQPQRTAHEKILMATRARHGAGFGALVDQLIAAAEDRDEFAMFNLIAELVATYQRLEPSRSREPVTVDRVAWG
jgi:FlaA1/EpsC-like NDP-sugar epimerase